MCRMDFFTNAGNITISDHRLSWKSQDFCFERLWKELGEPTGWLFWDSDLKKIFGSELGPKYGQRFFKASEFRRQICAPRDHASFRVNDKSYYVVDVLADSGIAAAESWRQLGIHLGSRTMPSYVAAEDRKWFCGSLEELRRKGWLKDEDWDAVLELIKSSDSDVLIIPPYPALWKRHTDLCIHAGVWESAHMLRWPGDLAAIDAQQKEWEALEPQQRYAMLKEALKGFTRLAPGGLRSITYADNIGPKLLHEARAAKK